MDEIYVWKEVLMLQIIIEPRGANFHGGKIRYICPKCGKEDFYVGYQTRTCSECQRELPDIDILLGKSTLSEKTFFKELIKC